MLSLCLWICLCRFAGYDFENKSVEDLRIHDSYIISTKVPSTSIDISGSGCFFLLGPYPGSLKMVVHCQGSDP